VPNNPFFAPTPHRERAGGLHGRAAQERRLCGARLRVVARGVPVGLGEPLYDKLDADIAYA
jgi:chorismate synthase